MGQKSLGPHKMSLEMAQKVIVPQKENYVPKFLKQRDINSYLGYKRPRLTSFTPPQGSWRAKSYADVMARLTLPHRVHKGVE
jgi:hypothetical protein